MQKMRMRVDRVAPWVLLAAVAAPPGLGAQVRPGSEGVPVDRYEVGTALPPQEEGAQLVAMTLDQAIERALEMNLDIQTARLSPRMQQFSLQSARAAFAPTFNGSYGYSNSTNQSVSQLDGGERTT
ncbi:MAG TPA: TolC family protein, partial [Longimicrobiales bacterium]|nr:TolC family protein [Longimicrobiales bacterium]